MDSLRDLRTYVFDAKASAVGSRSGQGRGLYSWARRDEQTKFAPATSNLLWRQTIIFGVPVMADTFEYALPIGERA